MWRRVASRGDLQQVHRVVATSRIRPDKAMVAPLSSSAVLPRLQQPITMIVRRWSSSPTAGVAVGDDMKVGKIALNNLARTPRSMLERQHGDGALNQAREALPTAWKTQTGGEVPPTPAQMTSFFQAAGNCRMPELQKEIFHFIDEHFPSCVSSPMRVQMLGVLLRTKDAQEMRAIFDRAVKRYDPLRGKTPPESVYRFGVDAAITRGDMEDAQWLLDEMGAYGVTPSNEILTRVLVGHAHSGNVDAVVSTFEKLDPQDGMYWHEADVNRVITSLGLVGKATEALDFYRRSKSPLSASNFMALLLVCRDNKMRDEALTIMANRRRFGLVLSAPRYTVLLETLEDLGISGNTANELALVLTEMQAKGIKFSARTQAIIARNQKYLQGTPYVFTSSDSERAGGSLQWQPQSRRTDEPLLRQLLDRKAFAQAALIADAYVRPVIEEEVEDKTLPRTFYEAATVSPPWIGQMAVEAYVQNNEMKKVSALLRGFSCVRGQFNFALTRMAALFEGKGRCHDMQKAYRVFRAMQFQGHPIYRVSGAFGCFRQFKDAEAASVLFNQVVQQIADAMRTLDGLEGVKDKLALLKRRDVLDFNPVDAIHSALRVFVDARELDMGIRAVDEMAIRGIPVHRGDYLTLFKTMRAFNYAQSEGEALYSAADFETVWNSMTRHGVAPDKTMLHESIVAFCAKMSGDDVDGQARRQRTALDAYTQASTVGEDKFVLPTRCYSTLLLAAFDVGSVEDVQAIYEDAIQSLGLPKRLGSAASVVQEWMAIRVQKVAVEGNASGALALLLEMPFATLHATRAVMDAGLNAQGNGNDVVRQALAKRCESLQLFFDPLNAVRPALRNLVKAGKLDEVVDVLAHLEYHDVPMGISEYVAILKAMREANQQHEQKNALCAPEDFEAVWKSMTRRGVTPNKAALKEAAASLCAETGEDEVEGRARRQRAVLEAYRQATAVSGDDFVLPIACFTALLRAATNTGGVKDVHAIYKDAVASLGSKMNAHEDGSPRVVPLEWMKIRVEKVAADDGKGPNLQQQ